MTSCRGWVDRIDVDGASGWIADPLAPGRELRVSIDVDGTCVGSVACVAPRADAVAAGFAGARAFRFDLLPHLKAGQQTVEVRFDATPERVPNGRALVRLAPGQAGSNLVPGDLACRTRWFVYDDGGVRFMKYGRETPTRQTGYMPSDPDRIVLEYPKMMMAALYLLPAPRRMLLIGLGGGTLARAILRASPDVTIDAVEIDPDVIDLAARLFDFAPSPQVRIHADDGRRFVQRRLADRAVYDLVMLDAFVDAEVPPQMQTREFLLEVRGLLADDGVLVVNSSASSPRYDRETATYLDVFGPFLNLRRAMRVIVAARRGLPRADEFRANVARVAPLLPALGVDPAWLNGLLACEAAWPQRATPVLDCESGSSGQIAGQLAK